MVITILATEVVDGVGTVRLLFARIVTEVSSGRAPISAPFAPGNLFVAISLKAFQ